MNMISIARDFSTTPGGRSEADGPKNGRRFRDQFLESAVKERKPITINLDGVAGLPGSFCDEAFGGIIRIHHLSRQDFDELFHFVGQEEDFAVNRRMIELNVERALREVSGN